MSEQARDQWGGSLEFIFTVISYAVGLGNVWRFPYLVYAYGGGAFVIMFLIILIFVGIPIFLLEIALGQFTGMGPSHVFLKMAPIFQGVGYASLVINSCVGFYYNLIIGYCIYYFIMSLRATLPWSSCDPDWKTDACVVRNASMNCTTFRATYDVTAIKSPSEEYFFRKVLDLSDSISNLGSVVPAVTLCLLGAWVIVFLALSKGVKSLGKVSYFTATFPYLMLTVLVITGALLSNSGEGIEYYIGSVNATKFEDPRAWQSAAAQVFFSTSACVGGLIAMSSFNNFKNNIIRDSIIVPILDCLTGIYAGFAIFAVLGHMAEQKCLQKENFMNVVKSGPQLAFVAYPEGISLIKAVPPLWSALFFLMMLALGFGSEFSIMETTITAVMDIFQKYLQTKWRKILMRLGICTLYFVVGLTLTTQGGFYILDLIDTFINGYPLLSVGVFETIVVGWVYGARRFVKDIELMVGPKPKWFWSIWIISWNFICPVVLGAIIVATFVFGSAQIKVSEAFPRYSVVIGWILSAIPIAAIVGCAIVQTFLHRNNWKALFQPDPSYYDNYLKYKKEQEENDFKERNSQKNLEGQKANVNYAFN